jgi:hypothetical protein
MGFHDLFSLICIRCILDLVDSCLSRLPPYCHRHGDLIAVLAIGLGAAIGRKPGIHHFFPSISVNPQGVKSDRTTGLG